MERFLTILFTMLFCCFALIASIIYIASDVPEKQLQPKQTQFVVGYFPDEVYVPNRVNVENVNSILIRGR